MPIFDKPAMASDQTLRFVKIEIPEFEDREMVDKNLCFQIYGLEQERPLVRINNSFYQGKWYPENNFVIFSEKKIEIPTIPVQIDPVLFEEKKKTKIKIIKLKTDSRINNSNQQNQNILKKLRLFRIPIIVR